MSPELVAIQEFLAAQPQEVQALFPDFESIEGNLIDGFLYSPETGEVLLAIAPEEDFRIRDDETLDWFLGKYARLEAREIAALNAEEVLAARALLANAEAIAARAKSERQALLARFEAEVIDYAQHATQKTKGRTWRTLRGTISLRTVAAGVNVVDETLAIAWAKTCAPTAVKVTEKLLVKPIAVDAVARGVPGLSVRPERESLTIKTGVPA